MSLENAQETGPSDEEARREKVLSIWSYRAPKQVVVPRPPVVNVLALCGAMIGAAAIFCSWFVTDTSEVIFSVSLWTYLYEHIGSANYLYLGGVLFALGTVAAFFTLLSSPVQIAGLATVTIELPDHVAVGTGFYMGILSVAVMLASVAFPFGPGHEAGAAKLRSRLFVITFGEPQPTRQGARQQLSLKLSFMRLVRANGKWISVLIAVLVWSTTVVWYENDFFRDDQLLTQVEGGIVVASSSFGKPMVAFDWDGFRLSLHAGESGVGWNFSNPELVTGTWCAVDLGTRSLGPLNVSLTAVNRGGDWAFGPGDQLALIAEDDTSFEENVTYRLWWKTDRIIAWTGIEISFVFHDGDLDSWVSTDWFGGL